MRFHDDEGGQAIVLIGASALALLLAVAVAIGAGPLFAARRAAQDAADAAAVAGAIAMYQEGTQEDIVAAARADAARNGYAAPNVVSANSFTDGAGVTVTVDRPPLTGAHAGDDLYVEVRIEFPVRGVFLLGAPPSLSVRAIASTVSERAPDAIVTLDPGGTSLTTSGSASISARGADIIVASRSSQAVRTEGSSQIRAEPPHRIRVAGGTSGGGFTPPPETGVTVPVNDPFAAYPPPDTDGVPVRTCCGPVLSPGIYPGGINTSGTVTMQPGIYILQGGGLSLQGGASRISGTGVLIFNTTSSYPATGGTCGPIEFQSNSFDLTAPTSGTYRGLVLWQDAACTLPMSLGGSASGQVVGTIYLPTAAFEMGGSSTVNLNSAVVTRSIDLSASSQMRVTFDRRVNAQRLVDPALSE